MKDNLNGQIICISDRYYRLQYVSNDPQATTPVKCAICAEIVANHYGLTVQNVFSEYGKATTTNAKHRVWFILHKMNGVPCNKVAEYFGADHSTVLWGCNKIKDWCEIYAAEKQILETLNKAYQAQIFLFNNKNKKESYGQ